MLLPDLLDDVREARAAHPGTTDGLLVSVYALVALVLIKVDQGELAWLAADRGMAVALAADDPQLAGTATVPLSQALRSRGRRRSALDAAVAAADRIGAHEFGVGSSANLALRGTLLLQVALAAAGGRDERLAHQSLDQAETTSRDIGRDGGRDGGGSFSRAAVEAARVVVEVALGDSPTAMARHERLVAGDEWRWLPLEHRAAYLLDVARAYARVGDMLRAGRTLLDAERTAHGEVHDRPVVRKLVAVVWRSADAPAGLAQLAATLHVT
ncbi:hypothetical protein ACIBTW_21620 [Micromonospora parva]|uniref:hypothetical protein n=1 Tax=Micromonospora parva TaxID=1464048 RepID=UPI0037A03781